jgi:uncharacterized membrane protein
LAALLLFVTCALFRIGLLERQGLWADELFSLALATGHSLEHPAERTEPALGDYVELPTAVPPSAYRRYLTHETPAAPLGLVIRATLLSDTNPPLYYLLLHQWTRLLGCGDAVLRLMSVVCGLACFPLIWSLARQVAGRSAPVPACTLFTFSPLCVYYTTEGRMYALLVFWVVSLLWLTLGLRRCGLKGQLMPPSALSGRTAEHRAGKGGWPPFLLIGLWILVSAAGLLTHYFYAFIWVAAVAWLWSYPDRFSRSVLAVAAFGAILLALPWYARLPEILASWRVTGHWLDGRLVGFNFLLAFLTLPWSYLSIQGPWGFFFWADVANAGVFFVLAVVLWRRLSWRLFTAKRRLLWLCLLAAWLGPVAFDLFRGTAVMAVPRYALAGMPAAFLLVSLGLSRLRTVPRIVFMTLIVLACLVGLRRIYLNDSRHYEPFRQLGERLAKEAGPSDLVIVHSIPSGVTGVARYIEGKQTAEMAPGFASWVGQLKQRRIPEDLERLAKGFKRIMLVKVHEVGEPAPEEKWLRENATLDAEAVFESASILYFHPLQKSEW